MQYYISINQKTKTKQNIQININDDHQNRGSLNNTSKLIIITVYVSKFTITYTTPNIPDYTPIRTGMVGKLGRGLLTSAQHNIH